MRRSITMTENKLRQSSWLTYHKFYSTELMWCSLNACSFKCISCASLQTESEYSLLIHMY